VAARNGGDNMQLMIERTGLFVMSVSLAGSLEPVSSLHIIKGIF
jgi:hypothetical protein